MIPGLWLRLMYFECWDRVSCHSVLYSYHWISTNCRVFLICISKMTR